PPLFRSHGDESYGRAHGYRRELHGERAESADGHRGHQRHHDDVHHHVRGAAAPDRGLDRHQFDDGTGPRPRRLHRHRGRWPEPQPRRQHEHHLQRAHGDESHGRAHGYSRQLHGERAESADCHRAHQRHHDDVHHHVRGAAAPDRRLHRHQFYDAPAPRPRRLHHHLGRRS